MIGWANMGTCNLKEMMFLIMLRRVGSIGCIRGGSSVHRDLQEAHEGRDLEHKPSTLSPICHWFLSAFLYGSYAMHRKMSNMRITHRAGKLARVHL